MLELSNTSAQRLDELVQYLIDNHSEENISTPGYERVLLDDYITANNILETSGRNQN